MTRIDPRRAQQPFGDWAARWLETLRNRKPKTRESYESIVRPHRLPRFGTTPIGAIDYPCVLGFVNELQHSGLGAGTIRTVRDVMRLVLGLAVRSGSLKANAVVEVPVSRTGRTEMIFLEPDQMHHVGGRGEPPAGPLPPRRTWSCVIIRSIRAVRRTGRAQLQPVLLARR